MDNIYFLNKAKNNDEYHIFNGHYESYMGYISCSYSLCHEVSKADCNKSVIENQARPAMRILIKKNKRNICSKCLNVF